MAYIVINSEDSLLDELVPKLETVPTADVKAIRVVRAATTRDYYWALVVDTSLRSSIMLQSFAANQRDAAVAECLALTDRLFGK
ncbi:hypothetical protein AWV79_35650 [Cupriavidus sp. UYMMa02A]|nr:hypothetical protein AWV79_35650 [Cupriavidus sp. UYMMa02A]